MTSGGRGRGGISIEIVRPVKAWRLIKMWGIEEQAMQVSGGRLCQAERTANVKTERDKEDSIAG